MRGTNNNNNLKFLILIVFILSLLSSTAFAIGISPSKKSVDFNPGQKITYGIDIVNNGHEDLEVILYPKGEFADRVKLSRQMLKLSSDEETKRIKVEFIMPEKLDTAGEHLVEIVAVGSTPLQDGANAVVKADIAVISKLIVEVPYPEKYAEARVHVLDTEIGKPVVVSVPVFNKGDKDIDSVHVVVLLHSSDGELVDEMMIETKGIKAGDNMKFKAKSTKEYVPGQYKAVATVNYDGKEIETETMFSIGELKIEIKSLVVNEFTLGDVAKFDILLYNSWNTELTNVYAEMQITDTDNNIYTDFKTVAINIAPREISRLEGYWYTKDVMPGVYRARVILNYANRLQSTEFELEVHPNKIITRPMQIGMAISAPEELNLEKNAFLILIILGMGLVIVVLVFKLKKRRKNNIMRADELTLIKPLSDATQNKPKTQEQFLSDDTQIKDDSEGQETVDEGGNEND